MNALPKYTNTAFAVLSFGLIACLIQTQVTAQDTYLDHLNPIVHFQFNDDPAKTGGTIKSVDGSQQLPKADTFPNQLPFTVKGPRDWTGNGWDFRQCQGPFLLKMDQRTLRVGDLGKTKGLTVSFWVKGTYCGRTSRIMAGSFDIGTSSDGIWGGTADYQNARVDRTSPHKVWDNRWHGIAVVVDFRAASDNIRVYVDGQLAATKHASYVKNLNSQPHHTWAFGARNAQDPGFDFGALADWAVFDRPLTADEVGYLFHGPVYAGTGQTVVLPNRLQLRGMVASGVESVWSQQSGPSLAEIQNPAAPESEVVFREAGDYEFELNADPLGASTVKIEVLPNQPPKVSAGNGLVVPTDQSIVLDGSAEDDSIVPGRELAYTWTVISAPQNGKAMIADATKPKSGATFSHDGLYVLKLTANDGELSGGSTVSFLVGSDSRVSYVRLLNPTVFLDFGTPPRDAPVALPVDIGKTGFLLRNPEHGMPTLTWGARPFTGYAWDFSPSDCDVQLINRVTHRQIFDFTHPGRSIAFWFKAHEQTSGYVMSAVAVAGISAKNGIWIGNIRGVSALSYRPNDFTTRVLDGAWHHLALVIDTSTDDVHQTLYLDGQAVAEQRDPKPVPYWQLSSPAIRHPLSIASRGRSGQDNYNGALDDFAIFDYSLTPALVRYLCEGPTPRDEPLLQVIDNVSIEAGENQYMNVDVDVGENHYVQRLAPYTVRLNGRLETPIPLQVLWKKMDGRGKVEFADFASAVTEATFTPVEDDKDGRYSKFVLRLAAVDHEGREIAGDDVTVLFYPQRAAKIRTLTKTPPVGRHPRILFTTEDLPELRRKADEVPVCRRAVQAMRNSLAKGFYDSGSALGVVYQKLAAGEPVSMKTLYQGNQPGFYHHLMTAAYVAWLGEDGTSDQARLHELAKVFATVCQDQLRWYRPVYLNALCHDASWTLPLCYDLLYNEMDSTGRSDARRLLSHMTRFRQTMRADEAPWQNSTNWSGFHDHILIAALAIEGEEGSDAELPRITERENAEFTTQYGIFDSGLPHEGYAYFTFGMLWHAPADLAISRRQGNENLFETTRFYRSIEAAFRLLDPNASAIRSHHDVLPAGGDSGSACILLPPRHLVLAKYLWPEDRMVDYVYGAMLKNLMQDEDRRFDLFHAVFGEPFRYPDQKLADAAGRLPATKFCPDRGFVMARDRWDSGGVRLDFRCRMDKFALGHQHADVNSFELWGCGREWIIDRGKTTGTLNDAKSTILIDGVGANSSRRFNWPSFPGRFVDFNDSPEATIACGDAKTFYDYTFAWGRADLKHIPNPGLKWSDFYHPRDGETLPTWMTELPVDVDGYGNQKGLLVMNPVKRAFRTVALVKGEHPFVLIVDDYEKDGQPHDYTWVANTPIDGALVKVSGTREQLILRHQDDTDQGPRLLASVLNANGQSDAIRLNNETLVAGAERTSSTRIEIPCQGVAAPDYRVLLYPHHEGDPLPQVEYTNQQISLKIGSQQHVVTLDRHPDGRTRVSVKVR